MLPDDDDSLFFSRNASRPIPPILSPQKQMAETTAQTSLPSEATKAVKQKRTLLFILVGGGAVLLGAYIFFGARYGIYVFGVNLFPFKEAAQKIGLAPQTPTPEPTPTRTVRPTPTPTKTPTPTPQKPQVNGRDVLVYGRDSEAGTVASLTYSPDRKKIAYTLLAGERNIWIMDAEDGSRENILRSGQASLPVNIVPTALSWSPDSTHLAVIGKDQNSVSNLYVVNIDANVVTPLTQAQTFEESVASDYARTPKWNSAGTELLVLMNQELWKMPRDGSTQTRITPTLSISSFAWSPDDSSVTYTIQGGEEENVWVMDHDGRNYKQLTFGGTNQLSRFNAKDTRILYLNYDTTQKRSTVFSINNRNGAEVKQLASISGSVREIRWSPDGNRVALLARTEDGKQSLWMVESDGSGLEEVLPRGEYEPMGFVEWSNNGDTIFAAGFRHFLISVALGASEVGAQQDIFVTPMISPVFPTPTPLNP